MVVGDGHAAVVLAVPEVEAGDEGEEGGGAGRRRRQGHGEARPVDLARARGGCGAGGGGRGVGLVVEAAAEYLGLGVCRLWELERSNVLASPKQELGKGRRAA